MEANWIMEFCFCWPIMRAMWRCATWPISCASTEASSDSLCAASISPECTAMKPPGKAKAFSTGSRTAKKKKS